MRRLNAVVRQDTLANRARDEVKNAIMSGEFEPGETITVRGLATELDIGSTPAREALTNLTAEGALILSGSRTMSIPILDVHRIRELFKMRVALECLAALEAAKKLNPEVSAALQDIHNELLKAHVKHDYTALLRLNREFHFTLYERAEMPLLLKMIETCWLHMGSYLKLIYPAYGEVATGAENHKAIIDAIAKPSPADLAKAIEKDINFASNALQACLESQEVRSK